MVNDTLKWVHPAQSNVPMDTLRLQMEVYNESILLRGFRDDKTVWVRSISADAIALVLSRQLGITSGLLPEGTVWWNQGQAGKVVAMWRPPEKRTLALQLRPFSPPERYTIPMPGTLFVCSPGRAPWAYACPVYPTGADAGLYRMPTFNVFGDGRVCAGNHRFPDEVEEIPDSFYRSYFSRTGDTRGRSRKHPDDLVALWNELNGKETYPLEDLVPQCTVAEAMSVAKGDGNG